MPGLVIVINDLCRKQTKIAIEREAWNVRQNRNEGSRKRNRQLAGIWFHLITSVAGVTFGRNLVRSQLDTRANVKKTVAAFCYTTEKNQLAHGDFQRRGMINPISGNQIEWIDVHDVPSAGINFIEKLVVLMMKSQQLTNSEIFNVFAGTDNSISQARGVMVVALRNTAKFHANTDQKLVIYYVLIVCCAHLVPSAG